MAIKRLYLFALLILVLAPMISAYSWGYYSSPMEYLNNEWALFGIITIIFFAIIFYTINKSFQNPAVSATIAIGLSLLIGMTFSKRMLLYGYAGEQLGSYILIVVALISIGFVIKFVYEGLGKIGTIGAIIGIWFIIHNIDPYQVFPYEMLSETFLNVYSFLSGIFGLIILIIIALVLIGTRHSVGETMFKKLFKR